MNEFVYIDSDVFDRLEKRETLNTEDKTVYQKLFEYLKKQETLVPYSNAHLSDLSRGYRKNPDYIEGHLHFRQELSNGLCIVQYWGQQHVTWHYRDIHQFFDDVLKEQERFSDSLLNLCLRYDSIPISDIIKHSSEALPANFKRFCSVHPIFKRIFPTALAKNNVWALAEDIYDVYRNSMKDYSVYHGLRSFVNQAQAQMKLPRKSFKALFNEMEQPPEHLISLENEWDNHNNRSHVSDNVNYQNFTSFYSKADFFGSAKKDQKFANMVDDSIHAFYGGHCDYFLSNDAGCRAKAKVVYEKLKIKTAIHDAEEFVQLKCRE